jgi:hypothetical protein
MAASPKPCQPFTIDLGVNPPSGDTQLDFTLEKSCNDDGTVGWKLHFELDEKASDGTMKPVVKLDIDVNDQDQYKAAATAKNGLDDDQRQQADITAQTANSVRTGDASQDDVKQQGAQVIAARNPGSPS